MCSEQYNGGAKAIENPIQIVAGVPLLVPYSFFFFFPISIRA